MAFLTCACSAILIVAWHVGELYYEYQVSAEIMVKPANNA